MKSNTDSQVHVPFVKSILSWRGTDGQCMATLHLHISALKPDQLTQPCTRDVYLVSNTFHKKSAYKTKTLCDMIINHIHKGD
jgi:hypothetical protein